MPLTDSENPEADMLPERAGNLLSQHAITLIALRVPAETIADRIFDLINAKLADGQRPDTRSVEAGVKLWLSYVVGMPVQRQHIVQEKRTTAPPMEEILASPAARETLVRSLLKSEAGREEVRAQLAVVDV